jgi:hypothetical protein
MKTEILRHFTFNYAPFVQHKIYLFMLIIYFTKVLHKWKHYILHGDEISKLSKALLLCMSVVFIENIVFLLILIHTIKMPRKMLFNALVISSFYYLFVLFMIIWEYSCREYFFVVELLVFISNSTAISVASNRGILNVYCLVSMSKLFSQLCSRIVEKHFVET